MLFNEHCTDRSYAKSDFEEVSVVIMADINKWSMYVVPTLDLKPSTVRRLKRWPRTMGLEEIGASAKPLMTAWPRLSTPGGR